MGKKKEKVGWFTKFVADCICLSIDGQIAVEKKIKKIKGIP